MKYIVLKAGNAFDLEQVVNIHINKGWVPTGGVSIEESYRFPYHQAMIKHID